jgi:hypothetical protein
VLALVLTYAMLGMVGTVVDRVELYLFGAELRLDEVHYGAEVVLGVEASGDASLVGYDDETVAEFHRGAAEREDTFDETNFFGAVEVTYFDVYDSVSVQEKGFLGHGR